MSRGSRLGIDTDTPRPASLDDYPLVAIPGWSSPAELARAAGDIATRRYGQSGDASSDFQEAYASSIDLDLLRQYAELYAQLTGTMLVPVGGLDQAPGEFAADTNAYWEEAEGTPATDQPVAMQPVAEEWPAPELRVPETSEEPNPVLFALGFLNPDDPF